MGRHAGNRGGHQGFRVSATGWEDFLDHLQHMSAIEVSKIAGMPSAPAFIKKRRRDSEFAARAESVMRARRLANGGRKRVTPAQVAAFLDMLAKLGVRKAFSAPDAPSEAWIFKQRRINPEFRARLDHARFALAARRERLRDEERAAALAARAARRARPTPVPKARRTRPAKAERIHQAALGEVLAGQLRANALYSAAAAAVSSHLPASMRDDVIADLVLAVLEGEIAQTEISAAAKIYVRRHWRLFETFKTVSLDAPIAPGAKTTFGDRLRSDVSPWL